MLRDKCPDCVNVLERNLLAGCSVITHYSGKGTAESAMADIGDYLKQVLEPLQEAQGPFFRFASACDISDMCRRVLCGHTSDSAAQHVFGDICSRVPTQEPPLSERSNEEVRSFLEKHGRRLYNRGAHAFCYKHNDACCLWDGLEQPGQPEERSGFLISAAGFSCTDWSPRRMSKRPGLQGATAPVFFHWSVENKHLQPDLLFWENSAHFDPGALIAALGDGFDHHYAEMSPDVLGWPAARPRLFGVSVLRSTCSFGGSTEEFLSWFMRKPQLDGDVFLRANEEEITNMMRELALCRGHGRVENATLCMAISPSAFVNIDKYKALQQSRADIHSGAFLCDLDQNPEYSGCGSYVPSCPTHSSIYSLRKERLMCGQEMLLVMGAVAAHWNIEFSQHAGLSVIIPTHCFDLPIPFVGLECNASWPSAGILLAGENLLHEGSPDEPSTSRMPRSRVADAVSSLSQKDMKHLAGNSFHLALFGTWAMYVLARVQKHPKNVPMPVMSTEYGTARSSSSLDFREAESSA